MAAKPIAQTDVGDFHFELRTEEGNERRIYRSDISDPARIFEDVTESGDVPPQVFSIFQGLMF